MGALCVSSIALRPCNHLEREQRHWNSPQGNWNHLERLERSSPLRGVRGVWNAAGQLELREAHNFSAERNNLSPMGSRRGHWGPQKF